MVGAGPFSTNETQNSTDSLCTGTRTVQTELSTNSSTGLGSAPVPGAAGRRPADWLFGAGFPAETPETAGEPPALPFQPSTRNSGFDEGSTRKCRSTTGCPPRSETAIHSCTFAPLAVYSS